MAAHLQSLVGHGALLDPARQARMASAAIGLVAYQCGFASQAHFSRRFKERFGQMPTEFKVWAVLQRGRH